MPKKKKTNPNSIPLKEPFDYNAYIEELIKEENIHACLLVMSALSEIPDMTAQKMVDTWFRSNNFDPDAPNGKDIKSRAEDVFDFHLPYPNNAVPLEIKTEGDVKKAKYRLRRNCVYSGLCVFCMAAYNAGILDEQAVRSTYLNAQITEEMIIRGRMTYEDIQNDLRQNFGILVTKDGESIRVEQIPDGEV